VSIKYDKLFILLKEKGYTTYKIRKGNIIGQGTLTAIKNGTGGLDAKTISKLCALLDCQPGDIMEFVPDVPSNPSPNQIEQELA
jgi:putative transcriptional regulator